MPRLRARSPGTVATRRLASIPSQLSLGGGVMETPGNLAGSKPSMASAGGLQSVHYSADYKKSHRAVP